MKTRTSRSDEGILALANSVFKNIFGLTDETSSRIMKMVRNQGQFQDLKTTVRQMSGVAHRRLNDVINMAQQKTGDIDSESDEHGDEDASFHSDPDGDASWEFDSDDNVREAMSFAGYLLTELQYSDEDLRDPAKRQQIQRMMRAGDAQADQLIKRGEKDQKMDARQEIQQEKDPRRAGLLRKRINLQRQVAMINKELGEPGAEDVV